MSLIEELSQKIVALDYASLSQSSIEQAKLHYIDFLAALLFGAKNHDTQSLASAYRRAFLLHGDSAERTAFFLSMLGNFSNFEDGCRTAGGHPSVVVMPALLSQSRTRHLDHFYDHLLAIVAGYEVFCRIGEALNPSHLERGFHTTSTVGAVASAAASCKLLKLNESRTAMALAMAIVQSSGLMESFSSNLRYIQVARSCENGVFSAVMAEQTCFPVSLNILEGKRGFFNAYADQCQMQDLSQDWEDPFAIDRCYLKNHGGCRHIHSGIDAVMALVKEYAIEPGAIERIEVGTYLVALRDFEIENPRNAKEAEFCIPFGIAVCLHKGNAYPWQFSDINLHDPIIRSFMDKVKVYEDTTLTENYLGKRMAKAKIILKDGVQYEKLLHCAVGEPEDPLSQEQFFNKMHVLLEHSGLSEKEIGIFNERSQAFRNQDNVSGINDWVWDKLMNND